MPDQDLDEVDLTLLSLIDYVRRHGVARCQIEALLYERLEGAFEIADEYSELVTSAAGNCEQVH